MNLIVTLFFRTGSREYIPFPNHREKICLLVCLDIYYYTSCRSVSNTRLSTLHLHPAPAARKSHIIYSSAPRDRRALQFASFFYQNVLLDAIHAGAHALAAA